jgi:hypothetical protein
MLTGIRGCVAPFLGSWLYSMPGVGRNVFGLSALVCAVSLAGFWSMSRTSPRKVTKHEAPRRVLQAT